MSSKKVRNKIFDQKFGPSFLNGVPPKPGVYLISNSAGELIYVGKAKNLKRRLGQYRNARRFKKHQKMRAIVKDASQVEYRICSSEIEALALELQLIQESRPKWNVEGAFYFLYPMIGIDHSPKGTSFCYTTCPGEFPRFQFYGAFRSRWIVGGAFFSLMRLFEYVGHRVSAPARIPGKFAYVFEFRQLPSEWPKVFGAFFKGESKEALEFLILALVENAAARQRGAEIQESLNELIRFWRHEAVKLARARRILSYPDYPVDQRDRDLLFLKLRHMLA